jgi:hypothetical protein
VILSGTQFGFSKGKKTGKTSGKRTGELNDEVETAFHLKNQVLAAFLNITRAYDNVLIDILCQELKKERMPIPFVFLLWDMIREN